MRDKKALRSKILGLLGVLVLTFGFFGAVNVELASSSGYPDKPVKLIVPFSPGGPTDIVARSITPKLSQILGQQIVVDNRGGAGSVIGTEIASKAPPDGYTLLLGSGSFVMNPAMLKKLPYDSVKDFSFITIIARIPVALVVHPSLPVKNVQELIALAKARPGVLNYGSSGRGAQSHFAMEWLSSMAGIKMVHVAYKGVMPALVELMAGQVQLMFGNMSGVVQFVRDGKIRMIAQSGKTRSPQAPDVPTFVESGLPGFSFSSNFGLLGPAGLPRPVVERVRSAVAEALTDPVIKKRLSDLGADPIGSTPEEHEAVIKSEIAKWIKVGQEVGIQPR